MPEYNGAATRDYGADRMPQSIPELQTKLRAINTFNPARNVYNLKASNTRKLRASLAKVSAGIGSAHHMVVGDSESDRVSGNNNDPLNMWHRFYRSNLNVPLGGDGAVKAGPTTTDPRIVPVGAWTKTVTFIRSSTIDDTLTFTTNEACTVVEVMYFNSSNGFSISIDGGGFIPVNPPGTGSGNSRWTSAILANTVHTVTVKITVAATNSIIGFNAYTPNTLTVHNCALYGSTAAQWATAGSTSNWTSFRALVPVAPDVVFISLGVNDINGGGRTVSQVISDITTIVSNVTGSDVILIGQYQPQGTAIESWQTYINALYSLADTLDVPLFDLMSRSGGYDISNLNGLMLDPTHPNKAAQIDWGKNIALTLIS